MSLIDKHPQIIKTATRYLNISTAEVMKYSREITELDVVYFWEPVRGGNSLIIGDDLSMLFATSVVSFDIHVKDFSEGKRTIPDLS